MSNADLIKQTKNSRSYKIIQSAGNIGKKIKKSEQNLCEPRDIKDRNNLCFIKV